jgi:2'-5' RNA ligase
MAEDFKESVMIALLPIHTDWCQLKLPHLTLVYAGDKENLKPTDFNAMAKDAASLAMISRPLTLEVLNKEEFGNWSTNGDDRVDVFRLRPTSELMAMRNFVEKWNASEFPFNPHVTIGPVGTFVEVQPRLIAFDRIMVGWGEEYLTFWLKR